MESSSTPSSRLSRAISGLRGYWGRTKPLAQAYLAGLAFVLICIPFAILGLDSVAQAIGFAGSFFLSAALIVEAYLLAVKLWEQPWGKMIGVAVSAAVVPMALGMSSMAVNSATGQQPGDYPYAVGTLAPLASVYVIAFLATIASLLGLPIVLLVMMLRILIAGRSEYDTLSRALFTRILAFASAAFLLSFIWKKGEPSYAAALDWSAKRAAALLDSYPNDQCAATKGERIKRISEDWVVVASSQGKEITFQKRRCTLGAQIEELTP